MYGPAITSRDKHPQMANHPLPREISKLLPALPHGLQTDCVTGSGWIVKDEWIESDLKPQSFSLHGEDAMGGWKQHFP